MEKETIEHFVTVIGAFATENKDGNWFTKESYNKAIQYTKDFLEEREKENEL